ncbi:MAG: cysteine--tRNA ligase [Planctomycetes bacterium]|nr:cysteine--tRNA ligase [Planctomycetota bacterium]NUQ35636.1 cysteine--tRNA ligase [Planctomycetaceae bacterium]
MAFRLYDTRLQKQVEFTPLHPGEARIYNCGPTVYGIPHIGNFRSFLFADLLRRHLEWRGLKVTQVMNITDVGHLTEDDVADAQGEDKLQKAARDLGWDPFKVARHFEEIFHRDRKRLRIKDAHVYPRATDHIREMLVLIQKLLDNGHAYVPEGSGEVYYDLASFPKYGELSHKNVDELVAGARVEVDEKKRNPADFFLWKVDPGHLMQWDPHDSKLWEGFKGGQPKLDPRIKKGFPGWHIECSAMSMKYLGETFDIHTGGEDNIFPHHECEIAQSEGVTNKPFARHWMHTRYLLVDNKKMSKRAGTLFNLDDLVTKGYGEREVRYSMLANHYRQPMNFTLEGLDAARASVERLENCRALLMEQAVIPAQAGIQSSVQSLAGKLKHDFGEALDDDLNMPNALAALFGFVNEVNKLKPVGADAKLALDALDDVNRVLDIFDATAKSHLVTKDDGTALVVSAGTIDVAGLLARTSHDEESVKLLVAARFDARAKKDFATSDRIRDELKVRGVILEDTKDGVRFKLPQ